MSLSVSLVKLSQFLHWACKYEESSAAILVSRLFHVHGIDTVEELRVYVEKEEWRLRDSV